jgi:metacaspase-1
MNYGVFIGINDYTNYPDEALRGPVNDCHDLANRLRCDQAVLLFTPDQTTKATGLANLYQAVRRAQPGDKVRIAWSSHGIDEGLCCSDVREKGGGWDPDTYVSYAELAALCDQAPAEVLIELWIDACHAHRGLRALGQKYGRGKYLELSGPPRALQPASPKKYLVQSNVILWSSCEPDQTSADALINGKFQGAFTAAFLANYAPDKSRADIMGQAGQWGVRDWLVKNRYDQDPHLYCWGERALEAI